jgi:hypothetical protein
MTQVIILLTFINTWDRERFISFWNIARSLTYWNGYFFDLVSKLITLDCIFEYDLKHINN